MKCFLWILFFKFVLFFSFQSQMFLIQKMTMLRLNTLGRHILCLKFYPKPFLSFLHFLYFLYSFAFNWKTLLRILNSALQPRRLSFASLSSRKFSASFREPFFLSLSIGLCFCSRYTAREDGGVIVVRAFVHRKDDIRPLASFACPSPPAQEWVGG